jgi:hypothetical protein
MLMVGPQFMILSYLFLPASHAVICEDIVHANKVSDVRNSVVFHLGLLSLTPDSMILRSDARRAELPARKDRRSARTSVLESLSCSPSSGSTFFFLTQKEKKETTTFDPNRPVPSDAF